MEIIINDKNKVYFFKILFTSIFTMYLNYKIMNISKENNKDIKMIILICLIDIISVVLNYIANSTIAIFFVNIFVAYLFSNKINKNIGFSLMITVISFCINYVLYSISIIVNFIIFKIFYILCISYTAFSYKNNIFWN